MLNNCSFFKKIFTISRFSKFNLFTISKTSSVGVFFLYFGPLEKDVQLFEDAMDQ